MREILSAVGAVDHKGNKLKEAMASGGEKAKGNIKMSYSRSLQPKSMKSGEIFVNKNISAKKESRIASEDHFDCIRKRKNN